MRRAAPALLATAAIALLGLAAAVAAAQEPAPESPAGPAARTWYAEALARGDAGIKVTYFWSRGAKLRAETVVAGHRIVTVVDGPTYYAWDALSMQGVAIERTPSARALDAPDRRPFGQELESLRRRGAEKVREEDFMGRPCAVYRLTDQFGRRELWVTLAEPQLPVHAVIFNRRTGRTQYTDYINWLSALDVGDSFFVPDPRVQFERYDFATYARKVGEQGPVGAAPILYADLLQGPRN